MPVSLIPTSGPAEFTANFTAEGTYTITASALGPDGQMYTSSVGITVMSKAQLEVLLQGKWEWMKSKLMAKDVEGAVAHLLTSVQSDYRTGFTAYVDKLPLLAQDLPRIELVYASEQRAKARLFREEIIKGQKMVNIDELNLTIFKAGYDQITPSTWAGIKKWNNEEVNWDGNRPTFRLKRLTMEERRNKGPVQPGAPNSKQQLFVIERNKEMIETGRPSSTLLPVE